MLSICSTNVMHLYKCVPKRKRGTNIWTMLGESSKQNQIGKDSDKDTERGDNYGKWKDQRDYNRNWWRHYQAW